MPLFPATWICITAHHAANLCAMGETAPQTVQLHPFSRLEFQARSFWQTPKSHQLMESLLLLFVMGSRVIHFVITIHLVQWIMVPLNTSSQQELSSFWPRADKQGLHNYIFSSIVTDIKGRVLLAENVSGVENSDHITLYKNVCEWLKLL